MPEDVEQNRALSRALVSWSSSNDAVARLDSGAVGILAVGRHVSETWGPAGSGTIGPFVSLPVSTRRAGPKSKALVHLTVEERDLLFDFVNPPGALDDVFSAARVTGQLVCFELADAELAEFVFQLEQAACSAQNEVAQERLGQAQARIDAGFEGTVDPGWHLVRPAIVRLGYSAKQGQYLAFIHAYSRMHRRAPAEADFQVYFNASPPVVHETLKTLQRKGFISRQPREARSTKLLLKPHEIPELE